MTTTGYSKIKVVTTDDALDLIRIPYPNKQQESIKQVVDNSSNPNNQKEDPSEEEDYQRQGKNDPKLRRNSSVSSAYALQTAVRRAFSMRRSSSVSERYCRIHDQSVTLASSFDEEEMDYGTGPKRSTRKNGSGSGKILKAWKKFFGL